MFSFSQVELDASFEEFCKQLECETQQENESNEKCLPPEESLLPPTFSHNETYDDISEMVFTASVKGQVQSYKFTKGIIKEKPALICKNDTLTTDSISITNSLNEQFGMCKQLSELKKINNGQPITDLSNYFHLYRNMVVIYIADLPRAHAIWSQDKKLAIAMTDDEMSVMKMYQNNRAKKFEFPLSITLPFQTAILSHNGKNVLVRLTFNLKLTRYECDLKKYSRDRVLKIAKDLRLKYPFLSNSSRQNKISITKSSFKKYNDQLHKYPGVQVIYQGRNEHATQSYFGGSTTLFGQTNQKAPQEPIENRQKRALKAVT